MYDLGVDVVEPFKISVAVSEYVIEEGKIIAEIRSYLPKDIKQSMSKPDDKMYKEIKLNLPEDVIEELEKPAEPAKQIKLKLCSEFAVRIVAAAQKSSIFAFSLDTFSFASGTNHVGHL